MEIGACLLDSNIVIDYIGNQLPEDVVRQIDEGIEAGSCKLSVINEIEVLGFHPEDPAEFVPFEEFVDAVMTLPLDAAVVRQTIFIRRTYKVKLPDAIIAATALIHDLNLLSRNESDFKKIPGLRLLNPHSNV